MNKDSFGNDFVWGVSTSAYQTEGSSFAEGKGPSIWDSFSRKKGKIYQGQNADEACDFYQRYEEDLELMHSMNIPNFRFSLSWPRILPQGTGEPNKPGIAFYNRLIDKCLALGIEPWVTLYHWDLPDSLEKKGGWRNRDILNWFREYVTVCVKAFGDRVKHWMVLNEPLVFTGAGYFLGLHAPGRRGIKNFLPAVHHATLCQAEGARVIKQLFPKAKVGTTFSCSYLEPYRPVEKDIRATARIDALVNRLFLEPALGLGYPVKELKFLKGLEKYFLPGDEELIKFDFDFIGIQNYTREVVKHSWLIPYVKAINIKAEKRKVPTTLMKWEVYPEALYHMAIKFGAYENIKEIYITENGAAFTDVLEAGEVRDTERLKFLQENLKALFKAKEEGVALKGYFVWTFTDNFEWAEGYYPRFGLVYVDFETQQRIIKASGVWYREFLRKQH